MSVTGGPARYVLDLRQGTVAKMPSVGNSSEDCFVGAGYRSIDINSTCFKKEDVRGRLAYLLSREIRQKDPALALACSSNDLGRVSWNVAYRLMVLAEYRKLIPESEIPVATIASAAVDCLLANYEKTRTLIGWSTRKYALDRKEPLALLVDNAMPLYPMLKMARDGWLEESQKEKIIEISKEIFDFYEPDYRKSADGYIFRKGIKFWADGVVLPFNQQNIFGLDLLEMYLITGDTRYRDRVIELAENFKASWTLTDENSALWNYWPKEYYRGWRKEDDISVNTPSLDASEPRYEDTSHSGINVKFMLEVYKNLPDGPVSANDIRLLANTLKRFQIGDSYSCFIDGNRDEKLSDRCVPSFGWTELDNEKLREQIARGLPEVMPLFESEWSIAYAAALAQQGK